MDGPKKTRWRLAALFRGGRGQRAQGRDRRHARPADQLGVAAELAWVMTEPAGVPVERAVLCLGELPPVGGCGARHAG